MSYHHRTPWILAIFISLGLNILFLYLMCSTVKRDPYIRKFPVFVGRVDVIKLKPKSYKPHVNKPKVKDVRPKDKIINTHMDVKEVKIKRPVPIIPFKVNLKLPLNNAINIPKQFLFPPPPVLGGIYSLSELDSPLVPILKLRPIYPMRARMLGVEGWVKVRFIVDEKGYPRNIRVIEAKPEGFFEHSTVDAISKWRFKPPLLDGRAVKVRVETTIRYKLE